MSIYRITVAIVVLQSMCCLSVVAQEQPDLPGPEKEHQWLHRFVGQWNTTSKASMGPDQPPMECTGTIDARMLGGLWLVNGIKSNFAGAPVEAIQTIGYDPTKKKYVGTWIDSMVNYLWHYEGTVDEAGKTLTLEATGLNFMADGKITQFRDAYEFKSADYIIITSSMLGEDGVWMTFMTGEAKRKKGGDPAAHGGHGTSGSPLIPFVQ